MALPAFTIDNLMEVRTATERTISFRYAGNPPAQQRPRLASMTRFRQPRRHPQWYDPDARLKAAFRAALTAAKEELGMGPMPFSRPPSGLELTIMFVLPRPRNDFDRDGNIFTLKENCSNTPLVKDIDNMCHFFMDALQRVLYMNDNIVDAVNLRKRYPDDNLYGTAGWADISVMSRLDE